MTTPTEIELKLSLPPDQADAFRSHPALQSHAAPNEENDAAARPRAARLVNHYFDTEDRLLCQERHGASPAPYGRQA